MREWLRRFHEREIRPLVEGTSTPLAFVLLLSTALLINKRYLGDPAFGGDPTQRWRSLAAWLFATIVFLLVRRLVTQRTLSEVLAVVCGIGALAYSISTEVDGVTLQTTFETQRFVMLSLAWVPVAIAGVVAADPHRRPTAGLLLSVFGLLVVLAVIHGGKVTEPLLHQFHYDKLNWCFLTFGWLFIAGQAFSYAVLGGTLRQHGAGLGRWKFWVPWTLLFLAFMVTVIVCYAGRQESFIRYYPMFKRDWMDYDPARDGWLFFALYEFGYGLYFLAWEFFFRGWMLFRLEREVGANAVWIQVVPFVIMHVGKPGIELHSALLGGLVLGWLAWRSRSFWPCFWIHWGIAATMDITAMLTGLRGLGHG